MKQCKVLLFFILILSYALWADALLSFAQNEGANHPSEVESGAHEIIGAKEAESVVEDIKGEEAKVFMLEECVEIAIRNHLPLKTTKKSMKLAEWRLWEARRNLLAKVGVKMEEHTGKIGGRRFYGKSTLVDIQQTVFHGGEYVYTMMQAETNVKIVKREYARIKNDLILQVKKGYYTLAKSKENLKLQKELAEEVLRIYGMVTKQYEGGIAGSLELLNVTSQMNQVRFQFTSAKGDVELAELILKQAMNVDVSERIDIIDNMEFKKVDVVFEKALPDALVHRPEMQISSMMVQYYIYELKVARAKNWPKIDFIGSFGMAKEEYISKDAGPDPATGATDADQKLEQQWYAGVKCSIPLWGSTGEYSYTKEVWAPVVSAYRGSETITNSYKFNFLDNLAQYSEKYAADVDFDKARQELIKAKQDVTLEVRESCFNYEKALLQLETAVNKVKYQESDLEMTKFRRQMDEVQDSNVVDSMIKLSQERFGYAQAVTDCNIAVASICKAVGASDYFKDQEFNGNGNGVSINNNNNKK